LKNHPTNHNVALFFNGFHALMCCVVPLLVAQVSAISVTDTDKYRAKEDVISLLKIL